MTALTTLYKWFSDLKKPNGAQFKALIDSFWHKSEKIPMDTIDGLDRIIEGTASAQQLQNHLTDTHAHKELLDKKVDKVEGKGLSSNDFTNAYKQQLDALEDYDIELDESTTELKFKKGNNVVRRISLMFLDDEGTKLVYNRTGKTLELRDKRDNLLTSIPVSHFVSNIPTNIVVQNGKIKLMAGSQVIDENTISYNDLADKPDLNFAPANHTHYWDDIDGKPNNLATTENVKTAIEDIEIGGRNYFLNSKFFKTTSFYVASGITVINKDNEGLSEIHSTSGNGNWVRIYDNPTNIDYFVDKYVTVSFDIKVLEGDLTSPTFYGGSFMNYQEMKPVSKKHEIGKWNRVYTTFLVVRDEFSIHLGFQYAIGKYQFKNFKFEIGNKPTDWTPAPEDIKEYDPVGNIINGTRQILPNEADKVIFVTNSVDNCALNVFPDKCSVSFRKVFDGGHVNFSCLGRNIIYTGDNQFNGKKGSTAVVSIYGNDCYIDIRNV